MSYIFDDRSEGVCSSSILVCGNLFDLIRGECSVNTSCCYAYFESVLSVLRSIRYTNGNVVCRRVEYVNRSFFGEG